MKKMNNKKMVAVIFGGKSVEHDISIITGVQVLNAIDKSKFNIVPIYISKNNIWLTHDTLFNISNYAKGDIEKSCKQVCICTNNGCLYELKNKKQKLLHKIDFAYLALHGNLGENGGVQGLLEMCNIPYSSPDVISSSVCANKFITKCICNELGIKTVDYSIVFEEDISNIDSTIKGLDVVYPVIVKPNKLGSSIGVSFCKDERALKNALSFALMFDREVLIESAVKNLREFNVAMIGNTTQSEVSKIEEVKLNKEFLTFENKYMGSSNSSKGMESQERVIPANIDEKTTQTLLNYSKKIFKYLGLKGLVRIDYLFDDENKQVYLNEINSIPGSLANYLFTNKDVNFSNVLEKLMSYALEDKKNNNKRIYNFSSSVLSKFDNLGKTNYKK